MGTAEVAIGAMVIAEATVRFTVIVTAKLTFEVRATVIVKVTVGLTVTGSVEVGVTVGLEVANGYVYDNNDSGTDSRSRLALGWGYSCGHCRRDGGGFGYAYDNS